MRLFQEVNGMIFEFDTVKEFMLFTLGRICAYLLIPIGWIFINIFLYLNGYLDTMEGAWAPFKLIWSFITYEGWSKVFF